MDKNFTYQKNIPVDSSIGHLDSYLLKTCSKWSWEPFYADSVTEYQERIGYARVFVEGDVD